jgi:hypothetical protein
MTLPDHAAEPTITYRELFRLVLVALVTAIALGVLAEVGTRVAWPESESNACTANSSRRPTPNCSARLKNAEGPWTTVAYNSCGYRSSEPCRTKPPNTIRVVVLGTSLADGLYVRDEDYFATRAESALAKVCGRSVQFLDVPSGGVTFDRLDSHINETLGLAPDAVLVVFAPFDLPAFDQPVRTAAAKSPESHGGIIAWARMKSRMSRALLIAQHFLLMDEDFFVRAYQLGGVDDVLREPMSEPFVRRYTQLDSMTERLVHGLSRENVPLYLLPVPNRIQAALLDDSPRIPGVNPRAFFERVRQGADRAGAGIVDVVPEFAAAPHAESFFYPVDGHLNGAGNDVLSRAVVRTIGETDNRLPRCGH